MGRAWVKRVSAPPLGLVARGVRATGVPDEWPSPALRGGIQNPAYRPSGAFPKSLPIPSQSGQPAGAHDPMPPAGGGPLMAPRGGSSPIPPAGGDFPIPPHGGTLLPPCRPIGWFGMGRHGRSPSSSTGRGPPLLSRIPQFAGLSRSHPQDVHGSIHIFPRLIHSRWITVGRFPMPSHAGPDFPTQGPMPSEGVDSTMR